MPIVHNKRNKDYSNEAIYVGRPTSWGNPYVIGRDGDRGEVVDKYARWIASNPALCERARRELRGKDLVCWCSPARCHADVLIEIANS